MPGTVYTVPPIPPDPEHTRWVDAGVLRFGVEWRLLDNAELDKNYEGEAMDEIQANLKTEAGPPPSPPMLNDVNLEAGQIIGKCKIERKLGQGGMGAVYLAEDGKTGVRTTSRLRSNPAGKEGGASTNTLPAPGSARAVMPTR